MWFLNIWCGQNLKVEGSEILIKIEMIKCNLSRNRQAIIFSVPAWNRDGWRGDTGALMISQLKAKQGCKSKK